MVLFIQKDSVNNTTIIMDSNKNETTIVINHEPKIQLPVIKPEGNVIQLPLKTQKGRIINDEDYKVYLQGEYVDGAVNVRMTLAQYEEIKGILDKRVFNRTRSREYKESTVRRYRRALDLLFKEVKV